MTGKCHYDRRVGVARLQRSVLWLVYLLACLGLIGCSSHKTAQTPLTDDYGQSDGDRFRENVNGFAVLADLFVAAGNTVTIDDRLSTETHDTADVIVYAPDEFGVPLPATVQWFNDWLEAKPGRTLIYIGRDFDALPLYWRKLLAKKNPPLTAEQAAEATTQLNEAQKQFDLDRARVPESATCDWFTVVGSAKHRDVRTLSGPWSEGVDAS